MEYCYKNQRDKQANGRSNSGPSNESIQQIATPVEDWPDESGWDTTVIAMIDSSSPVRRMITAGGVLDPVDLKALIDTGAEVSSLTSVHQLIQLKSKAKRIIVNWLKKLMIKTFLVLK